MWVAVMRGAKRAIAGDVFSQSGTEIVETYPIRKHLWDIIKF